MQIIGTIQQQTLGMGFWGIIGDDGENYRPDKLPKKLQKNGLRISADVTELPNQMSVFMWGKAVSLNSYEIL